MKSNYKILAVVMAMVICMTQMVWASAARTGTASIGFSVGGITYAPLGLSSVSNSLGFSFGEHDIDTSTPTKSYPSLNKVGYTVSNQSGGTKGYTVTLGLSAFDNGLEGATITLTPDDQGLVTNNANTQNPPTLLSGRDSVVLEADYMSSAVILKGTSSAQDPTHMGLGYWGVNLEGELNVYTNTIVGSSRALMTWELIVS